MGVTDAKLCGSAKPNNIQGIRNEYGIMFSGISDGTKKHSFIHLDLPVPIRLRMIESAAAGKASAKITRTGICWNK